LPAPRASDGGFQGTVDVQFPTDAGFSMTTPLQALAQLSHKDPTPEYFARFHAEISAENNHRGAVILLASNTEIFLRYAIRRHLAKTDYRRTNKK
jgi:hypothetical protein